MLGSVFLIMVLFLVFYFTKISKQVRGKRIFDLFFLILGVYGEKVYPYYIVWVNKYDYEIGYLNFLIFIFIIFTFIQDGE